MIIQRHQQGLMGCGNPCPYGMGTCPGKTAGQQCPCASGMRGLGITLPGGFDLSQTVTIPGLNITISIQTLLIAALALGVMAYGYKTFFGKGGKRRAVRRAQLQYQRDRAAALLS